MAAFETVLNIIPWAISVLCVILLLFGLSDWKKRRAMPPAVPEENAPQQEPPRSKRGVIGGVLLLVVAALNFGQGNLSYGIAMLLLGVLVLLKSNGVLQR